MRNFKFFYVVFFLLLVSCSCGENSCELSEAFFKGENKEERKSLKPWEKSYETVSGVKKEEVRLKRNFLTLDTQALSDKEIILKRKRDEEKKSASSKDSEKTLK
ncbi:MAG: hypothetical protein J0H12_01585 [Candidatus Paracaedimonas acanthamoebae]|uniref:Lipoprotein n=1 Tax=Candidatus Paracaedimonas acanthamoebae TaxID=244581 RepID=A0A8J7PH22_9PROT|nr:hypothetical protein [Candidatus Paracaedimonas acanthamoebae]